MRTKAIREVLSHPLVLLCLLTGVTRSGSAAWKWIPEDEHPCTIRRVTLDDVAIAFGPRGVPPLYEVPLVIRGGSLNHVLRTRTAHANITSHFAKDFLVTLSSSNALSERRRTVPLAVYLQEIALARETTARQLSNESWYLFGETYTEPWQHFLESYVLPPCQTCRHDLVALSFGIGNRGSGVQWHTHGPGFSEALHGRKHWILYPPGNSPAKMHKDQSSRQWMEDVYSQPTTEPPYECTRK
jgi:hypothetical protein